MRSKSAYNDASRFLKMSLFRSPSQYKDEFRTFSNWKLLYSKIAFCPVFVASTGPAANYHTYIFPTPPLPEVVYLPELSGRLTTLLFPVFVVKYTLRELHK